MEKKREGKWIYGAHEEVFHACEYLDTKEQAIENGKKEYSEYRNSFYVGQVENVDYALGVNIDDMLENIAQGVYDEVGEVAEDYLNHIKKEHFSELEKGVNKVVIDWMKKHGYMPDFFKVINIEKISINERGDSDV